MEHKWIINRTKNARTSKMQMYANILRTNLNQEADISDLIIFGFTRQMYDWWNSYLFDQHKRLILESKKKNEEGELILRVNGQPINDSVECLIFNIAKQFIGRYPRLNQNIRDYLHNLRCRSMSQFSEYNDYFMNSVYKLEDSQNVYWREKYIAG